MELSVNAFERVVASLLERQGFWVRSCVKVALSKEEKAEIGRPSSPRWEIDLVGYRAASNELRIVECKSYLDSRGVPLAAFDGTNPAYAKGYKLFSEPQTRAVVFRRLATQLVALGAITPNPTFSLCLAAGKIASDADRAGLHRIFAANGWTLWDEEWIGGELAHLAGAGYENDVTSIVAKLLLRKPRGRRGDA